MPDIKAQKFKLQMRSHWKAQLEIFYNLLNAPLTVTNISGHGVIKSKSRATHRALITCNMLCAMWYKGTAQLLSLIKFKLHLFQLYFTG